MLQKVLLISNKKQTAHSIISALKNGGFSVIYTSDSAEGLKRIYDTLPNVIILEDHLSVIDSIDLCHQIRQLPHIPLILLGDGHKSGLINGIQRGADFYMKRPISIPELVARVRALLRRHEEQKESVQPFLNSEEQTALVAGHPVKLSITEFRLLTYMVLNKDRVISTKEFLTHVWAGQEVSGDTLKFYISRLRQKLNHSTPHNIYTHRGVGYRLASIKGNSVPPNMTCGEITGSLEEKGIVGEWRRN